MHRGERRGIVRRGTLHTRITFTVDGFQRSGAAVTPDVSTSRRGNAATTVARAHTSTKRSPPAGRRHPRFADVDFRSGSRARADSARPEGGQKGVQLKPPAHRRGGDRPGLDGSLRVLGLSAGSGGEAEGQGLDDEEVGGPDRISVVGEEGPPALAGWTGVTASTIAADGAGAQDDA